MRSHGLKAATVRSRWVSLRSLYGWMAREEIVDVSPVVRVTVPRAEAPPVRLLSRADLKALFKACEGKTFRDRRDMALIRLLATTGLRKMEARDLLVDDVNVGERIAIVRHGKGNKGRVVKFDVETALAIDRYKRVRAKQERLEHLPWLFLSRYGRLSDNSVPYILGIRSEAAGLGKIGPHKLRHSWAHIMKESGATDSDLMTLGGWTSPEVMRRHGNIRATERALSAYDDVGAFTAL